MASNCLIAAVLALLGILECTQVRAADFADCTGVVTDENGVPVGAAEIQLKHVNGQAYKAETDGAGRFHLLNLPSGDYQVEIRKQGFFLLSAKALNLQSGPNELTFTLNHAQELHERVQVAAPSNQIDTHDPGQRSTLTARDIRDVPVPSTHVLAQSLIALPEIVRDNRNDLHVAGARSSDTQYLLDGFEISDPADGALTSRFNVDATRTVEVQTGRIGAGYAHSGAGVLSLETADGDDHWRFGTTNPIPGINIQEGAHLGNWYPRFSLSGPVKRGRFWFSDSISLQHTFSVVKEQPSGANVRTEWAGDNLLRLQFNVTPKHILRVNALYNHADYTNFGLDALNPQSTTVDAEHRRAFVSLKNQLWLYDTLFEVGVAADDSVLDFKPQGSEPYILLINGTSGNFFEQLHQRARRFQAMTSVTAASRHWHGTHQLSAGANVAGLEYTQSAQRGEIRALRADGTLVRQSIFAGPATPDFSNTQIGGFAQDLWSPSKRFLLQVGLRTDWDHWTLSAMTQPRVSASLLPFGDDRAKLSLGWGIYNAPLNLSLIGQASDQRQIDTFYDSTGTLPLLPPVVSQFVLPSGGLRQPRFTISSAGWQQKIKRNTLIGVELLARNGVHQFAYTQQDPTQPGGIFLLQDHRKDRYRSATLSARHIFSEATEVFAAFTRSIARSDQVLNPALGSIFFTQQQSGALAWDAPNRLLAWGWTPTHIWSVQLSYFFEYRSGYPFSVINTQQQLVGPPNSMRFPAYVSLNLALEKKFGLHGYLWAVRIEAVNALNRPNPNTVVNNIDAPNFGAFSGGQQRAFTARIRFAGRK
jgi:Carboxypeptidase regulatory-like domain/TonB dependent receptor